MSKRVLIVDDEPNIAISVDFLMRREGFEVLVAHDGEEGLARIRADRPDIIVLDVMMPKLDGLEVLKKIRENPETKDLLVIMLTNMGSEAIAEKIYRLGATDYFVKADFTPLEVANKVKDLLKEYIKN